MAVKNNAASRMTIKVVIGLTAQGTSKTASRTIAGINPALSDDDFYAIASALGALQSDTVDSIVRTDSADLAANA